MLFKAHTAMKPDNQYKKGSAMLTTHILKREMHLLAVLCIVAVLALSACAGSNTAARSPTPTPTSAAIKAHAILKHMPTGSAELQWDARSKTLMVKFSVIGLISNSTHPTEIDSGSCNHEGKVLYPLHNIHVGISGSATVISIVQNVEQGIPATGWNLSIHNGPQLASADEALAISCSDVSNTSLAHTLEVNMNTSPGKDQSASGMALLTLSGETLTVKLTMSGLEPNSAHAFHIHSGSCLDQGIVLYPLPDVMADASGKVNLTTVIDAVSSIPSSGWYVNVHYSTDLSTKTGQDGLVCGNIIPG